MNKKLEHQKVPEHPNGWTLSDYYVCVIPRWSFLWNCLKTMGYCFYVADCSDASKQNEEAEQRVDKARAIPGSCHSWAISELLQQVEYYNILGETS